MTLSGPSLLKKGDDPIERAYLNSVGEHGTASTTTTCSANGKIPFKVNAGAEVNAISGGFSNFNKALGSQNWGSPLNSQWPRPEASADTYHQFTADLSYTQQSNRQEVLMWFIYDPKQLNGLLAIMVLQVYKYALEDESAAIKRQSSPSPLLLCHLGGTV